MIKGRLHSVIVTEDNGKMVGILTERDFLKLAKKGVSKGAKPDYVRLAPLPRNFKGVVKLPVRA